MRVKLDENMPAELADVLGALGDDVATVTGQGWSGMKDEELVPRLKEEGRVLMTLDVEIADLRRFPPGGTGGVVLYRTNGSGAGEVRELVMQTLDKVRNLIGVGVLVVVSATSIRVRR